MRANGVIFIMLTLFVLDISTIFGQSSQPSYRWTKMFGGDLTGNHGCGYGVATDSSGNAFATGAFQGTVNFGLDFGTIDTKTVVSGSNAAFIIKLSPAQGFHILDGYGGVHAGGGGMTFLPATPYFGWNIARALAVVK